LVNVKRWRLDGGLLTVQREVQAAIAKLRFTCGKIEARLLLMLPKVVQRLP